MYTISWCDAVARNYSLDGCKNFSLEQSLFYIVVENALLLRVWKIPFYQFLTLETYHKNIHDSDRVCLSNK